jgi:predicted Fe-Mo cluster-binding NifX family protein
MNICITSQGDTLDQPIDPRFGRAKFFIIYDDQTGRYEALENPHIGGVGGVGVQVGQMMDEKRVEIIITGNIGPNAFKTIRASNITVYTGADGSVNEVLDRYKTGELTPRYNPTVKKDAGKRRL